MARRKLSNKSKPSTKTKSGCFSNLIRYTKLGLVIVGGCFLSVIAISFIAWQADTDSVPTLMVLPSATNTITSAPSDTYTPTIEPTMDAQQVDIEGTESFDATFEAVNNLATATAISQTEIALRATDTPLPNATVMPTDTATNDPLILTVAVLETNVQLTRNVPTATRVVFIPTELPETGLLRNWLEQQNGVDVVQAISVRGQDSMSFYAEVIVYLGYNTLSLAEAFNAAATQIAGIRGIDDVTIIISDGEQAIAYSLSRFDDDWRQTEMTDVDPPTPRPNIRPSATTSRGAGTTMYASDGSVRLRACSDAGNAECRVVDTLFRGDAITVYDIVEGSTYNGSTSWYRAVHNNQEVFVHTQLVQSNRPATSTPVPVQVVPNTNSSSTGSTSSGSGGTSNNVRPANCDEAVAMGLTAVQAAQWSHLDRDKDGVACYGD